MVESVQTLQAEPMQALKVGDFASRLGVSDRAIYRLIEQGEIGAFRVGRALRIPSTELERYVTAHMEVR